MTAITAISPFSELSSIDRSMSAGAPSKDFSALLTDGISRLNDATTSASEMLASFSVGNNVAPHDLVIAMEQAKLSMQLAVEIRNRLVDAYQEITRLQI